jgi:SAM-dependent methyltransferase
MLETRELPTELEYKEVDCDLCGASNDNVWDLSRTNRLTKCVKCGLVYTNPRLKSVEMKDKYMYDKTYFSQQSRMTEDLVEARKKTYKLEIAKLNKLGFARGSILDVGCGMGLFLESMNSEWDKHGCDVSSYALKEAEQRGVTTYHGEFEKLDLENHNFDVIYFRASLHHSFSPSECIAKAGKSLKKNGLLAIVMSNNCGGIGGKLFKGRVKSYEQAHNYLFTTSCLIEFLERNDMKIVDISYPYFDTGYARFTDFLKFPLYYLIYLLLKMTGMYKTKKFQNFSSPPFYGNYVSLYAKRGC